MRRALLSAASCCPAPPAVATQRAACSCCARLSSLAADAAATAWLLGLHVLLTTLLALPRLVLVRNCPNAPATSAGDSCAASAARRRANWPRAASIRLAADDARKCAQLGKAGTEEVRDEPSRVSQVLLCFLTAL